MNFIIKILDFLSKGKKKKYLLGSVTMMLLLMIIFCVIILFKYSNYDPFIYFKF
jgi:succinate dehydrogenase hydrophobic anchor subunit